MTDWPGSIAATITLDGCSESCDRCRPTAASAIHAHGVDWERMVRTLVEQSSWLDGIVVKGTEPAEDPDLPSLLAALKETGLPVRLDTNGGRPDVLRMVIAEQLVDFVGLAVRTPFERYDAVCTAPDAGARVDLSIALLISSGIDHEFRTALDPSFVTLDDLPALGRRLHGGRLWALEPAPRTPPTRHGRAHPYTDAQLRAAARTCSRHLPTVVRGLARPREAA